jgi:probable rRNA maturation factor
MIVVHTLDIEIPNLDSEFFVSPLSKLIAEENKSVGDLNLIFCSDEYLLEMNREHLDHDDFTDIITFDYCEENVVSGDLFISYDRVCENATVFDVSILEELCRVCAHGTLHLCGYGDKSNEEVKVMRQKEGYYLRLFGFT